MGVSRPRFSIRDVLYVTIMQPHEVVHRDLCFPGIVGQCYCITAQESYFSSQKGAFVGIVMLLTASSTVSPTVLQKRR